MNNTRRKRLTDIQDRFRDLMSDLESIRDEEDEAYTNMPESLQLSDKGDDMAEAIDNMDEAISLIEDIISYIDDAKGE